MAKVGKKPGPPRYCKTGDGREHYAKGYCRNCYLKHKREDDNKTTADLNDTDVHSPWGAPEGAEPTLTVAPRLGDLDALAGMFTKRGPRQMPGIADKSDDTEGMRAARQHLRGKSTIYRRRIIRTMLGQHFLEEDIINEFLENEELVAVFSSQLKDLVRVIREDIAAIEKGADKWNGRASINAREQYIEGLERALRLANRYAEETSLTAKDRVFWAKMIPDLYDKIAIFKRVAYLKPGFGLVPVGSKGRDESDDDYEDDDYEDDDELEVPQVRENEDDDDDD